MPGELRALPTPLAVAVTAPPASRRPFWGRPLVLALLVLVAGAALGAAAFAAEQRLLVWRPDVSAVAGGWRVAGVSGIRPAAPVIAGDHIAWGQGLYTCFMDLGTGETHVIGFASSGMSIWPPCMNARYVAWLETAKASRGHGLVWTYDIERGRRVSHGASANGATTALGAGRVIWYEEDDPARVVGVDLAYGTRSVQSRAADLHYPVLGSGGLIGWVLSSPERGVRVQLKDIARDALAEVRLVAPGSGLAVGDIQLAGDWLLWTAQSGTSTAVLVYDTQAGTTRTVVHGDVQAPATDGRTVVWVAPAASGAGATIQGTNASGGLFIVTRLATWPSALAVGGGRVAWTGEDESGPFLQTADLP